MAPLEKLQVLLRLPAIALSAGTTASTATETAAAAAPPATSLLGTRFIHRQRPAAHVRAVERRNRGLCLGVRGHLYESKSAGLARELVRDNPRRGHRAMRAEEIAQLLLSCRIGQTTDVNLRTHRGFLLK